MSYSKKQKLDKSCVGRKLYRVTFTGANFKTKRKVERVEHVVAVDATHAVDICSMYYTEDKWFFRNFDIQNIRVI